MAKTNFTSIGTKIREIKGNVFSTPAFEMMRFIRAELQEWRGEIKETPMGYLVIF